MKDLDDGLAFVNRFAKYWDNYNDKVFQFYAKHNLVLANFWIAYLVKSKKTLTPFSDPLTLFINEDFEELAVILIHELCHVLQTYPDNIKIQEEIYEHVIHEYPENSFDLNVELVTAVLTRSCLVEIYGEEKATYLLNKEKSLPILGKAWKIIDAQQSVLNEKDPIKAVFALRAL
jgi:hypothetical protein